MRQKRQRRQREGAPLGLRVQSEGQGGAETEELRLLWRANGQGYPSDKSPPTDSPPSTASEQEKGVVGVHKGWGANVTMTGCLTTSALLFQINN